MYLYILVKRCNGKVKDGNLDMGIYCLSYMYMYVFCFWKYGRKCWIFKFGVFMYIFNFKG